MHRTISLSLALLLTPACVDDSGPDDPGLTTTAATDPSGGDDGGDAGTDGDPSTTADSSGDDSGGSTSGDDSGGDTGPDDTGGGDTTGGGTTGGDTTDGGTTGDDSGGDADGPVALFAINEGNFNGDVDEGIYSIMTGCNGPSFDAYMNKVAEFPELANAKHFVTGWSCGATYALLRGYEHADVFRGIVHINQASTPYVDALEEAFAKGGEVRLPVFIIHDFGYDAGGSLTIQWLESKGYQMGVDLFVMDRPGTGHEPYLTDDEKDVVAAWFEDM